MTDTSTRLKQLEREQAEDQLKVYDGQIAKATATLASAQAGRDAVLKKLAELG